MNNNTLLTAQPGAASLVRPRYSPGLLLEDTDLTSAVDYSRNMIRLLARSLFGCGVICGLRISASLICEKRKLQVIVHSGVALDCQGNPIEVPRDVTLIYDPQCKRFPETVWVAVCYSEQCCMPADVSCCDADSDKVVHRRSQAAFEIRLYEQAPACGCTCEKPGDKPEKKDPNACCGDHANELAAHSRKDSDDRTVDLCDCYRDHLEGKCACACDCTCVVLGKFNVNLDQQDLTPSYAPRRDVRPMLVGAMECYSRRGSESAEKPPSDPVILQTGLVQVIADTRNRVERRESDLIGLLARKDELEVRLLTAEASFNSAQQALDKVAEGATEERVLAKKRLETAESARAQVTRTLEQVAQQIDAQRKSKEADEKVLERRLLERDVQTLQSRFSFIEDQMAAGAVSGLDLGSLREKRNSVAEELKAATSKLTKVR
jgi:hypothetical protein